MSFFKFFDWFFNKSDLGEEPKIFNERPWEGPKEPRTYGYVSVVGTISSGPTFVSEGNYISSEDTEELYRRRRREEDEANARRRRREEEDQSTNLLNPTNLLSPLNPISPVWHSDPTPSHSYCDSGSSHSSSYNSGGGSCDSGGGSSGGSD